MLKSFNGLTQQLFEKPFKNMLFSIYNFAEDEYYIHELKKLGYDTDIDSLEFITLDLNGVDIKELTAFRQYVENDLQDGKIVIGILFYMSQKGLIPIVIKPKSVKIEEVFKEA